ncbi:MAG: RNA-binding protein [Candidatus Altiarchaeota archaeon]|nr:RNA-binding protein [Candidatus Altiarchaeota archaeon]
MEKVCSICGAKNEVAVKFPCPSCGEATIVRCGNCRAINNPYKCPKCGFVGP